MWLLLSATQPCVWSLKREGILFQKMTSGLPRHAWNLVFRFSLKMVTLTIFMAHFDYIYGLEDINWEGK